jgi:hypothetical protein
LQLLLLLLLMLLLLLLLLPLPRGAVAASMVLLLLQLLLPCQLSCCLPLAQRNRTAQEAQPPGHQWVTSWVTQDPLQQQRQLP